MTKIFRETEGDVSIETLKLAIDELDICNNYCEKHKCFEECKYGYESHCFAKLIEEKCKTLTVALYCDIHNILENEGAQLLYKLRKIINDRIPETNTEKLDIEKADNETKAKICHECMYTGASDILKQINLSDEENIFTLLCAIEYAMGAQNDSELSDNEHKIIFWVKNIYKYLNEKNIKNNYTIEQLLMCIQHYRIISWETPCFNEENCENCEYNIYETLKDNEGYIYSDLCLLYKFRDCLEERIKQLEFMDYTLDNELI